LAEFLAGIRIPGIPDAVTPLEMGLRTACDPGQWPDEATRGVTDVPVVVVAVELGVYKGTTVTAIDQRLAAWLPPGRRCRVIGFDSFEGLPECWDRPDMRIPEGTFDMHGLMPDVPPNVELVKGWFDATLPPFAAELKRDGSLISLLHIDCDLYSSTKSGFDALAPHFRDGVVLVFDEVFNYPNFDNNEILALYQLLRDGHSGVSWRVEWMGKRGALDLHPSGEVGASSGAPFEAAVARLWRR
jgi:hypothetical protein